MNRPPSPCYKCTDHFAYCHPLCKKYYDFKNSTDEYNNDIREKKKAEKDVMDFFLHDKPIKTKVVNSKKIVY